jgi:hypothetical protein
MKTNAAAFSPQAKYTDLATSIDWRILVPTFADRERRLVISKTNPHGVNLGFPDRSRYFFFQVAPHLSS